MRLREAVAITVALTAPALLPQASVQGADESNQALVGAREGAWPNGLVVVLTGTAVGKPRGLRSRVFWRYRREAPS